MSAEAPAQEVVTAPSEDPAPYFQIDPDTDVHINCPDCFETLWLTAEECPTLADVIEAANKHKCYEDEDAS